MGVVGAHADMADHTVLFQLFHIIQDAVFHNLLQITFFINAVDKTKINVIGLQGSQLPVN